MSKIHRPPRGLQHLLGSQSFGENPDQLSQFVQPTVDLGPLYSAELLKSTSVIGVQGGTGLIASLTFAAPVAIQAIGCESGTAQTGNEYVGVNFQLDGLGGTNERVVIFSQVDYMNTGSYPTFGLFLNRPLVVPGGCQVSAYVHDAPPGTLTWTLRVLYVDLNPIDDT